MSIKRLANCAAGGTTAIAAAAMFNVAPAHAEGDLYTNAVGSSGTHLGYLGEDSTERVKVDVPSSRVAQAAEWKPIIRPKRLSPTLNPHLIRKTRRAVHPCDCRRLTTLMQISTGRT